MKLADFSNRLAWDLIHNNDIIEVCSGFIPSLNIQLSENKVESSCIEVTSQTTAISSISGVSSGELVELAKHRLKNSEKREGGKSNCICWVPFVTCGEKCCIYFEHPMIVSRPTQVGECHMLFFIFL